MFVSQLLLSTSIWLLHLTSGQVVEDKGSQELNNRLKVCADKNDVEYDLIDRFMSPYFVTELQEDKCFIMCVGISLGYVNEFNGRIIKLEKLPAYMRPGAERGKCLQMKSGRNPCDTAYLQFTCITTASNEEPVSLDYAQQGFVDY
ncbi:uncharacterized protein LOC134828726 [Culicoides brevitarsis]|uniref:uncharacterized protein LOC134828726 n=1 Tax=Culicoides brevitarsis TaxID=469753 RepID=UPI00307BE7D4